ncbi:dipeptidase pepE [Mycobacterium tuberculosis]|nr:dipeptidase pepE [Mycobacterium tuberculosis]
MRRVATHRIGCGHAGYLASARERAVNLADMGSRRFDAEVYARRLALAAAATADAGLAGLVITPGYDLCYLIGSRAETFERLTALVLPAAGAPAVGIGSARVRLGRR